MAKMIKRIQMKNQVSIIILAAGKGSRMKSDTPKVLHQICGKPMLFYSIQTALLLSDDIHLVLGHQKDKIAIEVQKSFPQVQLHIQDTQNFPGTAGALMKGAYISPHSPQESFSYKNPYVLILNGDMPLLQKEDLLALFNSQASFIISTLKLENPSGYGRVLSKDNFALEIIEEKDCTDEEKKIKEVNAGIYLIKQEILQKFLPLIHNQNAQKEYYITDLIKICANEGIKILAIQGKENAFMGVNSKLELSQAQNIMLKRLRDQAMLNGVIMHMPETIYLESDVIFEGECEIQEGVRITGKSKIISSQIKSHSIIESSHIEESDIGPLAHIRPNSYIKKTHIGNFVETKNATLQGVKAGHLSYLGDCEISNGSNVGAGVITCNYNGKTKHKTLIGENVFIGSDSQLIAPVKIESNTLIAAGSTITQNTQDGDLAISRTHQKNIQRGYYKFFGKKS